MNSLLTQQLEKLTALEQKLGGQAGAYAQVTEAAAGATDAMGGMADGMNDLGNKVEENKGFLGGLVDSMKKFNESIKQSLNKYLAPLQEGLSLLGVNFESLTEIISNPLGAAFGFLRTAYNSIIEKAAKLIEEQYELLNAFEEVRDKFGSFNENTSRRIKTGYEQFSGALRNAAGNSTAFASKFQMGIKGSIEQLQKIAQIAEDLGPIFDSMGQQFNDSTAQLYVLRDGLHFSSEALQQTARLAQLNGKSVKQFSQEIMASVDKIGRNFGVSTKVLGADVGKALSNFKMLGKMTGDYVKQITQAAVFTRKLGFELSELTGLVDKFDDFEQGAEASAQLAQGFGLVLDPLKMMNMQDPAARLQEVQRAFVATGRSVESMTRQERALLASTSGLDEKILSQALSAKGLSQSYDEIAAGADAASKKQKSTEEVMTDLADNIENVITPFEKFAGFVDAFIQGFLRGFGTSGGMMSLLKPLAEGMLKVAFIGGRVGKIVADLFFSKDENAETSPLVALAQTISDMFVGISTSIEDFAKAVNSGDISGGVTKLFDGIWTSISKAFSGATGGFDVMKLVSKVGTVMLEVLNGALKFFAKKLPEWTASLKTMFKKEDESGVTGGVKSAFDVALESLTDTFKNIDWMTIIGDFGGALIGAIGRFFEKYPIGTLFVAGGPIMVALGGIVSGVFENIGSIFSSDAAKAAGGGGGAAGAAAAVAGISAGVEGTATQAVVPVVEKSQGIIERIFNILEEPAKITAMATAIAFAIKKIGAAVRDVLLSFMDPLPGRDDNKSFVDVVVDSAKKFQEVSWQNLLSLGGVLAAVFLAVGGLVAIIATQANKFSGMQMIGLLVGGAAFAYGLSLIKTSDDEPGFFGKLLNGVGSLIEDIVTPFGKPQFMRSVRRAGVLAPDAARLSVAAGSIKDLLLAVQTMVSALPRGFFGGIDTEQMRADFKKVMEVLMGTDTKGSTAGIIPSMATLSVPSGLGATVGNIKPASDILKTMVELTKDLQKFTGIDAALSIAEQILRPNNGLFAYLGVLPGWMNFTFTTPVDASVNTNIKAATATLGHLKDLQDKIMEFTNITEASLRSLELTDYVYAFKDTLNSISTELYSMEMMDKDVVQYTIAAINSHFAPLVAYADNIRYVTEGLSQQRLDSFVTSVKGITEHTLKVREILENLPVVPLDATLDRMESDMKVAKTALTINGGAVNVNVQLNVTMNAEKMATALVVAGYLDPTTEFGEYVQNNDGVGEMFSSPEKKYANRRDNPTWRSSNPKLFNRTQ
jgi:hypothetical protein